MLSYPGSVGPTHVDRCWFCPDQTPIATNWFCQGYNFGTRAGRGAPANSSAGMFGRYPKGVTLTEVTDGLSNTVMAGETIPPHYIFSGAFIPNSPVGVSYLPKDLHPAKELVVKAGSGAVVYNLDIPTSP